MKRAFVGSLLVAFLAAAAPAQAEIEPPCGALQYVATPEACAIATVEMALDLAGVVEAEATRIIAEYEQQVYAEIAKTPERIDWTVTQAQSTAHFGLSLTSAAHAGTFVQAMLGVPDVEELSEYFRDSGAAAQTPPYVGMHFVGGMKLRWDADWPVIHYTIRTTAVPQISSCTGLQYGLEVTAAGRVYGPLAPPMPDDLGREERSTNVCDAQIDAVLSGSRSSFTHTAAAWHSDHTALMDGILWTPPAGRPVRYSSIYAEAHCEWPGNGCAAFMVNGDLFPGN